MELLELEFEDADELELELFEDGLLELDKDELLEDEADELLELELLSSIERTRKRDSRGSQAGPGNWSSPVWKFKTCLRPTSPVVFVSWRTACQIVFLGSNAVAVSVVPPMD